MMSWWKRLVAATVPAPPAPTAPPSAAPSDVSQAWASGFQHHQAGRLAEAARLYGQVLAADPRHFDARHLLGVVALQEGRLDEAMRHITEAIDIDPREGAAHSNLGTTLLRMGRPDEARICFEKALALDPNDANAASNLAVVLEASGLRLVMSGRFDEARDAFEEAVRRQPGLASAHANLGALLRDIGQLPAAAAALRQALALQPGMYEAQLTAALVALALDEPAQAQALLAGLVQDHPRSAEAHATQGRVWLAQGRLDDAETALQRAIGIDPDLAQAHHTLGLVQMARGDAALARASHERASALDLTDALARWAAVMARLPAFLERPEDAAPSRDGFAAGLRELDRWFDASRAPQGHLAVGSTQPFYLAYQAGNHKDLLAPYGRLCERLMAAWPARPAPPPPPPRGIAGRRIRIGVVSAQVRDHSVWTAILRGWVQHLDRSRFEVHLFNLGTAADAQTAAARTLVHRFEGGPAGLQEWVVRIGRSGPDVLVYPEVGMDAVTLKLASLRLAPLQLATWGHPLTTGLPTLDAFISAAAFEPADAQTQYGEELLALPGLGVYYEPLEVQPQPVDRRGLGLPAQAPLLVCPGLPYKYAPGDDELWVEIARRLPQARLVFFKGGPQRAHEQLRERLGERFAARGLAIDNHVSWLPLLSRPQFFGLLREACLFLDSVGFSGFNTAMQAVECELPIVALEGAALRGRFGSGVLREIGLPECVAADKAAYADLAVALAGDAARRAAIQDHIRQHRNRLFATTAPVRALEAFIEQRLGADT